MTQKLTSEHLLAAYAAGYFPMAEGRESDSVYWYYPQARGVLPLDTFHVPRSLRKFLRHCPFTVTVDTDFDAVIRACADRRTETRTDSWLNETLIKAYCELARRGYAHSVECRRESFLVGGLYGVSLGGAFFGESMFSLEENASKVALVHLVGRLKWAGYVLLDTQYVNDHLLQFGAREIARGDYLAILAKALQVSPNPSMRFCTVSENKS